MTAAVLRNSTATDYAAILAEEINQWCAEHPVVGSKEEGNEAASLISRARKCMADAEDERKAQVSPLNARVKAINEASRASLRPLVDIQQVISDRLWSFQRAEEERRQAEAARLKQEALDATAVAHAAARSYSEAVDDASQGEVGVDVLAAREEAVASFDDAARLINAAKRAERDAGKVRFAPGNGERAISARTREELFITDIGAALAAMGVTERIADAVLTEARAYRRIKGALPPGIGRNEVRAI